MHAHKADHAEARHPPAHKVVRRKRVRYNFRLRKGRALFVATLTVVSALVLHDVSTAVMLLALIDLQPVSELEEIEG